MFYQDEQIDTEHAAQPRESDRGLRYVLESLGKMDFMTPLKAVPAGSTS